MILDGAIKLAETVTEEYFLVKRNDKSCVYRKRKIFRSKPTVFIVADTEEDASMKLEIKLRKEKHTFINYSKLIPQKNITTIKGELI